MHNYAISKLICNNIKITNLEFSSKNPVLHNNNFIDMANIKVIKKFSKFACFGPAFINFMQNQR